MYVTATPPPSTPGQLVRSLALEEVPWVPMVPCLQRKAMGLGQMTQFPTSGTSLASPTQDQRKLLLSWLCMCSSDPYPCVVECGPSLLQCSSGLSTLSGPVASTLTRQSSVWVSSLVVSLSSWPECGSSLVVMFMDRHVRHLVDILGFYF